MSIYSSTEVKQLEYYVVLDDGKKKLIVSREDGSFIEIDVSDKPDVSGFAPLISPAFTGNPTAPTQIEGNNTTRVATTAFVVSAIMALINTSPAALDTLNELATALGNDPNFATTMATALAGKVSSLQAAMNPDFLIVGTITRDANGAATSAPVIWPDDICRAPAK